MSEKAALDLLISKDRYDKRLLPPSKGKRIPTQNKKKHRNHNNESRCSFSGWLSFFCNFADDLPVNVSVLLLTLASPDESSLVIN